MRTGLTVVAGTWGPCAGVAPDGASERPPSADGRAPVSLGASGIGRRIWYRSVGRPSPARINCERYSRLRAKVFRGNRSECGTAPRIRYRSADLLFPSKNDTEKHLRQSGRARVFYPARESARRPDLRFHDLRHTGALPPLEGATVPELAARLGNSTPAGAMRCQQVAAARDAGITARFSAMPTVTRGSGTPDVPGATVGARSTEPLQARCAACPREGRRAPWSQPRVDDARKRLPSSSPTRH